MRPDEGFLVGDAFGHQLSDKFGGEAVCLKGGLALRAALGWTAQFGGTIAARVPGIGIDDPGTENAETDAAAVFEPEGLGETQHRVLGRNIRWQADRRGADRMM